MISINADIILIKSILVKSLTILAQSIRIILSIITNLHIFIIPISTYNQDYEFSYHRLSISFSSLLLSSSSSLQKMFNINMIIRAMKQSNSNATLTQSITTGKVCSLSGPDLIHKLFPLSSQVPLLDDLSWLLPYFESI